MKPLVGILLLVISVGVSHCVMWADFWSKVPGTVDGITYYPNEELKCDEPNFVQSLLNFPPDCHLVEKQ